MAEKPSVRRGRLQSQRTWDPSVKKYQRHARRPTAETGEGSEGGGKGGKVSWGGQQGERLVDGGLGREYLATYGAECVPHRVILAC